MDDGIYSSAILFEFFSKLQKSRIPVETRMSFAKAIAGFYDFLSVHIDAAAGKQRLPAITQGRDRIAHILRKLREEGKSLSSYRAIRQPAVKEYEPYAVARAIATDESIRSTLHSIYRQFGRTDNITRRQYNYFLGALMFYIVQCNTARNEVIYKMRYGSIVDFNEQGLAHTGLRPVELDVQSGPKELFVGAYPHPKSLNRLREQSSFTGGFFVLDEESRFLQGASQSFRIW
ncbi:unnamed protein product [Cylicostephanus goldi]|uniref:Uncharacterized protein n=1 Tax=Cylicostephanus goldi TaxID=71465 RepID=A0A3P7MA26_CYLGO|nr:unnamed protein product [Cylicostephanus goldi]